MTKVNSHIGTVFLQLALSLLFIVGGIWTLQSGNGDEISIAIKYIFSGDLARILCIVFGIIEIIAGVFLFLRLFLNIGTLFDSILMIIILISWIAAIIVIDFLGADSLFNNLNSGFLGFLNRFARHLLVLGAIIRVKTL
ncbi:MAG: hypothetical protein K5866_01685 [Treponema sp.]|nr:hypothetical protein [Treponema sp.]